jgi:hypothetical protein
MSVFSSMATPAGTNAKRSQEKYIRELANKLGDQFNLNIGNASAQVGRQGQVLDTTFQQLMNLLGATNAGGSANRVSQFNASADAQAAEEEANAARELGQYGLGDGAVLGAKRKARNTAANAKNQFFSQEFDPANIANRLNATNGAAAGWMGMSSQPMNNLLQLFGGVNSQQPVQVQPGIGQTFGQLAQTGVDAWKTSKGK